MPKKPTKVYIVRYKWESYIEGVFSTKEKAQAHIDKKGMSLKEAIRELYKRDFWIVETEIDLGELIK